MAIGLGANLPPREESLRLAVFKLTSLPACQLLGVSSLYESPAWKCEPGAPDFLNAVVMVETNRRPGQFLELLHKLELEIGGPRPSRNHDASAPYHSRALDLDLLLVGTESIREPGLVVPHPGVRRRDFILRPLCEVAPDWPIPPDGRTAAELLVALPAETLRCRVYAGPGWTRPAGPQDL
ncbi:2-amino-4-hydroxy-6-hydroxymethyldihydropteridine diphosphokinase [bacterium]|nr:2-amino-4-hydroxy-6-hydroxymethyldihydropteridine diphosphokinase [bacterium]